MMQMADGGDARDKAKEVAERTAPTAAASCSRKWSSSSYKNPRIVRVSRSFGGKDRHSKVCTVRGLRDRRIRLSVPTAVQLYSLQDRLGLSQPSKVVDWLLDATKHEIEKLPPLPAINMSMNMLLPITPTPPLPFHFQPYAPTHFLGKDLGLVGAMGLGMGMATDQGVMKEKQEEAPPTEEVGLVGQNLTLNNSAASFQNPYFHWDLHNPSHFGLGAAGFNFPFHTHTHAEEEEEEEEEEEDYDDKQKREEEEDSSNQIQNSFHCTPHYFCSTPFLHDPSLLPPTTLKLINQPASSAAPPHSDCSTATPQLKTVEPQ